MPVLEPAFVWIGHCVWAVPGIGRFYRHAAHRYCERLRGADRRFRVVRVEGQRLRLDVTEFTAGPLYFGGRPYEPLTARCLRESLPAGGVFVDVGANHGYFTTLAAALVGPDGRVFAFEPNPVVFEQMARHLSLNGMSSRVTALGLALSDAPAAVPLFVSLNATNSGLSSLAPAPDALAAGWLSLDTAVEVQADTFDHWLEASGVTSVDLVKIDAEGAEARVLRGMAGALDRQVVGAIVCETEPGGAAHQDLCRRGFTSHALESFGRVSNILYVHASERRP